MHVSLEKNVVEKKLYRGKLLSYAKLSETYITISNCT